LLPLVKIKEIANNFQIESLKREIAIAQRYSARSGTEQYIDVMVLGQFKSGKSSLINSLINEDILPVGVVPVTSIITRLQYYTEEKAQVQFLDGSSINISTKQIENFIAESKNSKNIKRVEVVDLFLPKLEKFGKIRIIDTPGIGSFFKHNSDVAIQWLPEIGLALLAISVERPLSEDDILLLKDVKRYTSEIKIILTKTDLLSSNQLKEVMEYIKNSLSQAELNPAEQDLEILPYSTIKDVDKNRNQLTEKVFSPLKENFSRSFENIFRHKIYSIIQSCLSYLEVGFKSSYKTEKERERLKDAVIDEHLKFQIIKNELDIISQSYKDKNRESVSSVVMSFLKENRNKLENDFQKEYDSWQGNLFKVSRKFEQWLENKLKEELFKSGEKSILQLDDYVRSIQNHFHLFASSFAERLNRNVEKVLGIKLNNIELQTEVEKIKQPDISVSYSFDIHIDLLWFLFPMFIFKGMFKKFFQKKIPYEVEKNLNRLTSDIAENISKVIERNRQIVSKYIYNELLTIENVVKSQKNESAKYEKAIEEISKLKD